MSTVRLKWCLVERNRHRYPVECRNLDIGCIELHSIPYFHLRQPDVNIAN